MQGEEEERRGRKEKLREENSVLEISIKALNHELEFMLQVVKTHSDAGGGQAMKNQHFEELFLLCHEKLWIMIIVKLFNTKHYL